MEFDSNGVDTLSVVVDVVVNAVVGAALDGYRESFGGVQVCSRVEELYRDKKKKHRSLSPLLFCGLCSDPPPRAQLFFCVQYIVPIAGMPRSG